MMLVSIWPVRPMTLLSTTRYSIGRRTLAHNLRGLIFILASGLLAWQLSRAVLDDQLDSLVWILLFVVGAGFVIIVMNDWQKGVYCFLFCLLFEDLFRKYLGNNLALFFAKDMVAVLVYVSFLAQLRRGKVTFSRPPVLLPVLMLAWFAFGQIFNPASPSLWFGFLGFKLFFFYFPFVFIGYSLIGSEAELKRFFKVTVGLIFVIVSLGIAQSILGHTFLNPTALADEVKDSAALYRVSPITGALIYRPCSVFVSTGRYVDFLMVAWVLTLGFTGYLLLRVRRGRLWAFGATVLVSAGAFLTGSRGCFLWTFISALAASVAFLWGAPWKQREVVRVFRSIARIAVGMVLAIVLLDAIFPEAIGARVALYAETLLPDSRTSELRARTWDYPITNFLGAFDDDRWLIGHGIGTTSLGTQYVSKIFRVHPVKGVESGFGTLVVEMGIGGLALWFIMSGAILISAWRIVGRLRGQPWFPIGFAIFWYSFVLLFPSTYGGLQPFEDFLLNAYLWILLGILYRLPTLAESTQPATARHQEGNFWARESVSSLTRSAAS